jgi:hypothetical protein
MIKAMQVPYTKLNINDKIIVWRTDDSSFFDYKKKNFKNRWIEINDINDPFYCCPPKTKELTRTLTVLSIDLNRELIICDNETLIQKGLIDSADNNAEWVLIIP